MGTGGPYGTWRSPISAALVAEAASRLAWPALDGGRVWWHEQRPREQGRGVVCSSTGQDAVDHTAPEHNVRSLVHEYGGLPFTVRDGTVWYCNFADQRVWRRSADGVTVPVTPPPPAPRAVRYADLHLSPDADWLTAVRERHEADGVHNDVVAIPTDGAGSPTVLVDGSDFYAAPRISPDGASLAWLSWEHPAMPWDHTTLATGTLSGMRVTDRQVVADGAAVSVLQPEWSPDGALYFISDADGWWNLHRRVGQRTEQLTHERAELGFPLWQLGTRTYAFVDRDRIACVVNRDAAPRLHLFDVRTRELAETPLTSLLSRPGPAAHDGEIAVIAGTEHRAPRVHRWRLSDPQGRAVSGLTAPPVDTAWLSTARHLTVPTDGDRSVHAVHWPPTHPDAAAPAGPPPLLVDVHGGPTGQIIRELDLEVQFWTSRGIAVVAPNYGGSTGYGRRYRERLRSAWGIVDVADCVAVARWLVGEGLADPERLAIRGGSAGGYTTLAALTQVDDFTAGVSRYGVSDLRLLAAETHKFESRYLDGLVGDDPAAWSDRAPIEHVDRISAPVLLLQGAEDEIVPPSQAERIVAELDAARSPYAYVTFPGEQHGFRRAASIRRALEIESAFYARVWGFEPTDAVESVEVVHHD